MQIQVLGLGSAGEAAAQLLAAQQHQVIVLDEQDSPLLQRRLAGLQGVSGILGEPFALLPETKRVVVSPGIRWQHPVLELARTQGIEVMGEAELAWRHLDHLPWVGITGTNGKTTTTALIAAMFAAAGWQAPACGNIGLPLCRVAKETLQGHRQPDWIVAELSSYQLEASSRLGQRERDPLGIGVWTTFTPDHLERHGTLENYAAIKARLLDCVGLRVINGDDAYLQGRCRDWPNTLWTSIHSGDAPVRLAGGNLWIESKCLGSIAPFAQKMPGQHNQQNLLMAAAVAHLASLPDQAIQTVIHEFAGVPHRLETVRVQAHIRWINDSKATNYDAAEVGLAAVAPPILLIAGGQAKQGDDRAWLALIREKVAFVYLIGEAAPRFARRLEEIHYTSYQIAHTLDVAVSLAHQQAKTLQGSVSSQPITVLFSPACASFDQFSNFEHRGDVFRQCCYQLVE
ncbi:MAG: UDP-N-acetylmuramoyl-L-alanine--D-glutamate ligase [Cyanobacteriota bacterium]|nr:UDP-N-acetylmuramoyl-L-alanine--D-glutamate ligase [Cyanobacteriota bacterium]